VYPESILPVGMYNIAAPAGHADRVVENTNPAGFSRSGIASAKPNVVDAIGRQM